MKAATMFVENRGKIKTVALALLLMLAAVLGSKVTLYWQEAEIKQKEALASFVNRYSGYKDPRERCISEILKKEENPSVWQIRRCLKEKKQEASKE